VVFAGAPSWPGAPLTFSGRIGVAIFQAERDQDGLDRHHKASANLQDGHAKSAGFRGSIALVPAEPCEDVPSGRHVRPDAQRPYLICCPALFLTAFHADLAASRLAAHRASIRRALIPNALASRRIVSGRGSLLPFAILQMVALSTPAMMAAASMRMSRSQRNSRSVKNNLLLSKTRSIALEQHRGSRIGVQHGAVALDNVSVFNACVAQSAPVPYGTVLATNAKLRRTVAGIKQASCSKRMRALGFDWHPQTVGAVERGERRLTAEEVLGLSLALVAPIAALLIPDTNIDFVTLPDGKVVPAEHFSRSIMDMRNLGEVVRWTDDDEPEWFMNPRAETSADRISEGSAALRGLGWGRTAPEVARLTEENAELRRQLAAKDAEE
jgi:hypothetical protein